MCLVDLGVDHGRIVAALPLLKILEEQDGGLRPLMPHPFGHIVGDGVVDAVGEGVVALRQGDIRGFDLRDDGVRVQRAGAINGLGHEHQRVVGLQRVGLGEFPEDCAVVGLELFGGVVGQGGHQTDLAEGAPVAVRNVLPVLFRLDGDLVGDADGVLVWHQASFGRLLLKVVRVLAGH